MKKFNSNQSKARAPAKLIISGEHAVVYGSPAIAMAVNYYAESTASPSSKGYVYFNLLNLKYAKSLTLQTLKGLKKRLLGDYTKFLNGQCSIREVIEKPFELLQFTISNVLEQLNLQLQQGVELCTYSFIPIGCGMGSSAATITSALYAFLGFLKLDVDKKNFFKFSQQAENLQHGKSSGIDLHLAMHGGCVRYQNNQSLVRSAPKIPLYIVNTGSPASSTGECVTAVKSLLANDYVLQHSFAEVTLALDTALQNNSLPTIQSSIQENHRLLNHIGVVPKRVNDFIKTVEKYGAAAKICGAGSVRGNNGGIVLLVLNETISEEDLAILSKQYGYSFSPVKVDTKGVHIV